MSSVELTQAVAALTEIAAILDRLGVPGLIALLLAGPAAVLVTILILDHLRGKRLEALNRLYHQENRRLIEQYRTDTKNILDDYAAKHAEVVGFHRDCVGLVQQYKRIADGFQDVVIGNTRMLERMTNLTENNMHCPLAREGAKGRK